MRLPASNHQTSEDTIMAHTPQELVALDKKYVWHHLTQHKGFEPAIYVKGEGMRVTDIAGKTYLDAVSGGVWTVNVGYGRKEIVDAVAKQMLEFTTSPTASGTSRPSNSPRSSSPRCPA